MRAKAKCNPVALWLAIFCGRFLGQVGHAWNAILMFMLQGLRALAIQRHSPAKPITNLWHCCFSSDYSWLPPFPAWMAAWGLQEQMAGAAFAAVAVDGPASPRLPYYAARTGN